MKLHPHAAGLIALLDRDWRRKLFVGGLVLMIPVVGWPALLGFRSHFVRHLFSDAPAALPSWGDGLLAHLREGLKALAVIFGYLLPLYLALGITLASRGYTPGWPALAVAACFATLPIFATLSLPFACIALALAPERWLTPGESALALAAFSGIVFLIPAGFLQVSSTGRYRSAFALWRTLPFVARHFPAYLEAWWLSSLVSLAGHLTLPLAPWGVAWCYLAILALFNEVLHRSGEAPGSGWLARAIGDARFAPSGRWGARQVEDARGEPVTVLELGSLSAPMPRLRRG